MMQANSKPIWRSAEYRWQTDPQNPKRVVRGAILKSLKDFLSAKRANPRAPYGSNDKTFSGNGHFTAQVPGIAHAHLSHDLSIVYRIQGGQIYLYGFYTHDQLGTGQPANMNKQKAMAQKFKNTTFTE